MKSNWWKIIFTALLLSIVALLSTFIIRQQKVKNTVHQRMEHFHRSGSKSFRPGMEHRFRKDLNFSDTQLKQLEKHRATFHQGMQNFSSKRRQLERQLYIHPNLSDEEIDIKADSIGILFAEQQRMKYYYMQELRKICTEEQKHKLDSLTNLSMHRNIHSEGKNMRKRHGMKNDFTKQLKEEKHEKH
ncbi:MAG: hypothetical protein MI922_19935 [Bacteroidales bacterium]|nr:hypothetical protein [Bacteroidales bacterium]